MKDTLPWHSDMPECDSLKLLHDKDCNTIIFDDHITKEHIQFIEMVANNHYKLVEACKMAQDYIKMPLVDFIDKYKIPPTIKTGGWSGSGIEEIVNAKLEQALAGKEERL